jgi:hypothetical protein
MLCNAWNEWHNANAKMAKISLLRGCHDNILARGIQYPKLRKMYGDQKLEVLAIESYAT